MLKKKIQPGQWISFFVLTVGVTLVQLPPETFSGTLNEAAIENKVIVTTFSYVSSTKLIYTHECLPVLC